MIVEVLTQFAVIDNVVDYSVPLVEIDALFTHSIDHILILNCNGIVVMLSQAITTLPTSIFYVLNMLSIHTWFQYYFTGVDMVWTKPMADPTHAWTELSQYLPIEF